jgi:hypothetical protein
MPFSARAISSASREEMSVESHCRFSSAALAPSWPQFFRSSSLEADNGGLRGRDDSGARLWPSGTAPSGIGVDRAPRRVLADLVGVVVVVNDMP